MNKPWIAIFLFLALVTQACSLPLSLATPTEAGPSQTTAIVSPVATHVPASVTPGAAAPTPVAATNVPVEPASPTAPTATSAVPQTSPTVAPPVATPAAPAPIPMKYSLQPGTPTALTGFVHADLGCNWMGAGGQVFSTNSTPVERLVVELGGTLNGQPVSQLSLTGSATNWGPGGYEFSLGTHPVDSSGTLWLRVLDLNGNPLSDRIYFTTYNDCAKNSVLINLVEPVANQSNKIYVPFVGH